MISFGRLYEFINNKENDSVDDSKLIEAIKAGINVREDFWKDFMNVIGNGEGISELLDVPKEKISSWSGKIQELLEKVKNADALSNDRSQQLSTGEEMANPNGDEEGTDLRPTP